MSETKFIAYLVGEGEGCDYTIGCNHALVPLSATTLKAAKKEVFEDEAYRGRIGDENGEGIESISIFEIKKEHEIDMDEAVEACRDHEAEAEEEEKERAEFARLSAKFGKARK